MFGTTLIIVIIILVFITAQYREAADIKESEEILLIDTYDVPEKDKNQIGPEPIVEDIQIEK